MSNVIKIKRGSGQPGQNVLSPYELGYDKTKKRLYVGQEDGSSLSLEVDTATISNQTKGFTTEALDIIKATKVKNAENATNATSATNATNAVNATNATNATYANDFTENAKNVIKNIKVNSADSADSANTANSLTNFTPSDYTKKNELLNLIYPVGSIYLSVNSTSPATLFGGTWSQLKDRFLLGAGSSYSNGSTGGAATVTLTSDQMPSHSHSFSGEQISHDHATFQRDPNADSEPNYQNLVDTWGTGNNVKGYAAELYQTSSQKQMRTSSESITPKGTVGSTGGGNSHNNMPPYLVVYMWKRTA